MTAAAASLARLETIRSGVASAALDGAYARSGGWTIHPYGGKAQSLSGNHIVVNTLPDMQHPMGRGVNAAQGQLKKLQRRFVGLGLLRGDDFVEIDLELGPSSGEEIVVDIGENREAKAGLQLRRARRPCRAMASMREASRVGS